LAGLCLDLAGGAYTSPPDPLAVLRGLLLREWEVQPASKGRGGGEKRKREWLDLAVKIH